MSPNSYSAKWCTSAIGFVVLSHFVTYMNNIVGVSGARPMVSTVGEALTSATSLLSTVGEALASATSLLSTVLLWWGVVNLIIGVAAFADDCGLLLWSAHAIPKLIAKNLSEPDISIEDLPSRAKEITRSIITSLRVANSAKRSTLTENAYTAREMWSVYLPSTLAAWRAIPEIGRAPYEASFIAQLEQLDSVAKVLVTGVATESSTTLAVNGAFLRERFTILRASA